MTPGEVPFTQAIDEGNRRYLLRIERASAELRHAMIAAGFEALQIVHSRQEADMDRLVEQDWPEGSEIEYFVLEDYCGFPFEHRVSKDQTTTEVGTDKAGLYPQHALSLLLRPPNWDAENPTTEQVKLFIPIADDQHLDEHFVIETMEPPTRMGIQYTDTDGKITSYVVDVNGISAFNNPFITGEQTTDFDRADENFDEIFRPNTNLELIAGICEDLLEWKVQVQRTSRVGEPWVQDNPYKS